MDFAEGIERSLADAAVVLVVIGKQWLTLRGDDGARRIDDPEDVARLEIERALARSDLRVSPVRVDGAAVPDSKDLPEPLRPLVRRNGPELRHDRWKADVESLLSAVKRNGTSPMVC